MGWATTPTGTTIRPMENFLTPAAGTLTPVIGGKRWDEISGTQLCSAYFWITGNYNHLHWSNTSYLLTYLSHATRRPRTGFWLTSPQCLDSEFALESFRYPYVPSESNHCECHACRDVTPNCIFSPQILALVFSMLMYCQILRAEKYMDWHFLRPVPPGALIQINEYVMNV